MSSLRLLGFSTLLVAALARPALAADDSARLLQCVPADVPFLMHFRSVSEIREDFAQSPYAKLWAEPEVQAFLAPTIAFLNSPDAQGAFGKFEALTGLRPLEFFSLFSGELVLAGSVPEGAEGTPKPHIIFGGVLGENRARFEAALKQASTSSETEALGTVEHEEFQGETLHTFFARDEDSGEKEEAVSWAVIDDVVWFGYPKTGLQGVIADFKRGAALEPITASASFGPVYQRNPGAQAVYFINMQRLVQIGLAVYQAQEAARQLEAENVEEEEDEEPAQPNMLEQMGITPDVIVHALGLDALRGAYMVTAGSAENFAITAGMTWTEQRGLLRLLAYGDAPAPQPAFVAPNWASVTAVRYKISDIWEAVKETARAANPMFEFMLAQQLAGLKQQVGIDLERDFFGAFGDVVVQAQMFPEGEEGASATGAQLWAASLSNAEAFNRTLEVAWAMAPQVAQMFEDREYLGHTIRTISVPMPGVAGMQLLSLSHAVTPGHVFVAVNGAGMIEAALQRLDGEGDSFWKLEAVVAALKDLPAGSSSFTYQDVRQVMYNLFVQVADAARKSNSAAEAEEDPGLDEEGRPMIPSARAARSAPGVHMFVDPTALPRRETIEKHFGTSYGGVYRDADGIRFHARYKNAP